MFGIESRFYAGLLPVSLAQKVNADQGAFSGGQREEDQHREDQEVNWPNNPRDAQRANEPPNL
jgi:hypothetical protein